MSIENISSVNNSYQGQGSSANATPVSKPVVAEAAVVEVATTTGYAKQSESQAVVSEEHKVSNEQIRQAVEKINKNTMNEEAVFGIHEKTNRVTIKIIDKTTKEVIKEFPPEKTLDMIAKVWEMAGIMVDERR